MAERLSYDAAWWERDEEGHILVFDESTREWDVWDPATDDRLPPPEWVGPIPDSRPPLAKGGLLRVASIVALIAGAAWIASSGGQSLIFVLQQDEGFTSYGEVSRWLQVISGFAYPVWLVAVGSVVLAASFAVLRYTARLKEPT